MARPHDHEMLSDCAGALARIGRSARPLPRLARPLEIHSGLGRLRLAGKWQAARETHITADLGSTSLDRTRRRPGDRRRR